jgi:hypothetical protein
LKTGTCSWRRSCQKRHPQKCCYWQEGNCWRGSSCVYQHEELDFNTKKKPANPNIDEKEDSSTNEDENIELTENDEEVDNEIYQHSEDEETSAITTDEILRMYENISDESSDACRPTTEEIISMFENTSDEIIVEGVYKLKKSTKMKQPKKS